jgi:hypothetical protein
MAIVLFRFLYKEEEYAGNSLTGKASKSGEKRPPVDQEKLTGIYGQCFFFFSFLVIYISLKVFEFHLKFLTGIENSFHYQLS